MKLLLSLFPMQPLRCPCCHLRIDGNHVWAYRECAACGAVFRIRRRYFWTMYVLAVVVSFGLAFVVGNRGYALSSLASLLVLPTLWRMLMVNLRLFPAGVEVAREGWTWRFRQRPRTRGRVRAAARTRRCLRSGGAGSAGVDARGLERQYPRTAALSTPPDPPVSLEGIAIAIAVAALFAWHLYSALEPRIDIRRTPPLYPERSGL